MIEISKQIFFYDHVDVILIIENAINIHIFDLEIRHRTDNLFFA